MSVRGFNTGSGIEQYDYDYLANKPATPTKESIGLGNVDNTSDMNKPVSTAQEQALSQKVDKVPGMGLSQEDYTSAEKEKLGDLPTNEELEADLAGKASAETVAALESAVNDPDNGLETKASAIINTASGAIASFSDGADGMPIKKLVVNVEPQQDLHGYDHPWPAGGGANLLDPEKCSVENAYGLTVTHDQETEIWIISGTPSSQSMSLGFSFCRYSDYTLSGKGYTVQAFPISGTPIKNLYGFRTESENAIAIVFDSVVNPTINVSFKLSVAATSQTSWTPYSNECPISGWTGAEIVDRAINIWDEEWESGVYAVSNGIKTPNANYIRNKNFIKVHPNTKYYLKAAQGSGENIVLWYGADGTYLNRYTGKPSSAVIESPSNAYGMCFYQKVTTYNHDISINYPATDTTYHAYEGSQISVTFPSEPGTVYGATLTLNPDRTGTLVVDRAMVDLGTLTYNKVFTPNNRWRFVATVPDISLNAASVKANMVCSVYKTVTSNETYDGVTGVSNNVSQHNIIVCDMTYSDAADLKSAMSGVQCVYPLATPITYTLTESEISGILTTLYGTNNVWSNAGNVTVEYTADTKLFIEQLTQPTEDDMTADHAISAGTFFMIGNTLYLATSQIAAGATITPGTNATKLSLADALNQLNA